MCAGGAGVVLEGVAHGKGAGRAGRRSDEGRAGRERDRHVGHGAKGAVVTAERIAMLVHRDGENHADHVEDQRGPKPRMDSPSPNSHDRLLGSARSECPQMIVGADGAECQDERAGIAAGPGRPPPPGRLETPCPEMT
jgi:hypothetical protein